MEKRAFWQSFIDTGEPMSYLMYKATDRQSRDERKAADGGKNGRKANGGRQPAERRQKSIPPAED